VGYKFDGVDARALPAQIEAEMERLVVYADAQERKVTELQTALDARVVIEQAIGILAERFVLPFADAFEVLRAAARNSRREVRAVAEELRSSRETPLSVSEVLPPAGGSLPGTVIELHREALRCPRCGTLVTD
jgi:AmiR/NasT family two-component response regulator